jgi:hypothetical protein
MRMGIAVSVLPQLHGDDVTGLQLGDWISTPAKHQPGFNTVSDDPRATAARSERISLDEVFTGSTVATNSSGIGWPALAGSASLPTRALLWSLQLALTVSAKAKVKPDTERLIKIIRALNKRWSLFRSAICGSDILHGSNNLRSETLCLELL